MKPKLDNMMTENMLHLEVMRRPFLEKNIGNKRLAPNGYYCDCTR